MLNLGTSKKTWKEFVEVATTEKVKDLKAQTIQLLHDNVRNVFQGVKLTPAFKEYCKTLMVGQLVKDLTKNYVNSHVAPYMEMEDLTFEQKQEIRYYFCNIANVATEIGKQEIKEATKEVEKHILAHINAKDYVLLGVDFTSVSTELMLVLNSAKNNTLVEFNALALMLYATQLSGKKIKEVKDTVIKAFGETEKNAIFNSTEDIPSTQYATIIEKAGKKVNMKRLTAQFLSCQNKVFVIKPQTIKDLEKQAQA